ncbi:MAG: putative response regulator, CheY [Fibrobacteres bacterium]|nr:putative response regulator, CheY [Fibrobacterota bacterium]
MTGKDFRRILLVDDDPNDILLFRRAFAKLQARALLEVAENADQAEACLSDLVKSGSALPTFVLLDLKLPGRSGMDLLKWIRGNPEFNRMIVIALTSSRERNDVRRAYEAGINSFIVKPSGFDSLFDSVKQLWEYWTVLNEHPDRSDAGPSGSVTGPGPGPAGKKDG